MKFPFKRYKTELTYFNDYMKMLGKIVNKKHLLELSKISSLIEKKISQKKQIFVCGNGGSAAIANHFLCDFNKGLKIDSNNKIQPKFISLSNSIELISAISNDISFNDIFSFQLENYGNKNDLLILLSCSGNSKNILNTIKITKKKKIDVVSILGFAKKKVLKENSKYYINLDMKNYGLTEDIFQIFMHMISQYLRQKTNKRKLIIL